MRRISILTTVLLPSMVWAAWLQATAQTGPKIVTFDVPGAVGTEPVFINPAGVVTGQYFDAKGATHGFVRSRHGVITPFDVPEAGTGPGQGTVPWSINPAGEVTGWYTDSTGLSHGFARAEDGTFRTFDAPNAGKPSTGPCSPPVICSSGTQSGTINAAGMIGGQYVDASDVFHGFLRSPGGSITTFDAPGAAMGPGLGTYITTGDGINLSGAIIGGYGDSSGNFHGFVRAPDGIVTSFDPSGSVFTDPAGINEQGVIMGFYAEASGPYHGFLRSPGGKITLFDLSGAGTAGGQGTEPLNINAPGDITGTYIDSNGVNHAFLRTKQGAITTFDVPQAGAGSGQGTVADCNNPADLIIGFYIDANGAMHGFLRE